MDHQDAVRLGCGLHDGGGVERLDRSGVDHLHGNTGLLEDVGRLECFGHHPAERDDGDVVSFARYGGLAERDLVDLFGYLAACAEKHLVQHEDHGVVVAHRRHHEALGVVRVGRHDHLQTRGVRQPALKTLRVLRARADPGAVGHRDHHGDLDLPAVHELHLGRLVHHLVERDREEVHEHDVDDRTETPCSGADAQPDEAHLGDGGIDHPTITELGEQAVVHVEDAAVCRDVLADDKDVLVFAHDLRDGLVVGLDVGCLTRGRRRLGRRQFCCSRHVFSLLGFSRCRRSGRSRPGPGMGCSRRTSRIRRCRCRPRPRSVRTRTR